MSAFFTEIRENLVPPRDGKDGPLPPLLVALTLVTGVAMFTGAFLGVLAILYASVVYPFVIAFVVISIVSLAGRLLSRKHPAWVSK